MSFTFSPEDIHALQIKPIRIGPELDTDWIGHIPFAFYIMQKMKPKVFVELGVRRGVSYSAFCQAVNEFKLDTKCYGIDHWKGDSSTQYGPEVYEEFKKFQDDHFSKFSTLMKQSFDDAVDSFEPGSIDLLHIDGSHLYKDVSNDYQKWIQKMSDDGVILLHDITAEQENMEVGKFYEERITASRDYNYSFSFKHCNGLGIIIPFLYSENKKNHPLRSLIEIAENEKDTVRNVFMSYAPKKPELKEKKLCIGVATKNRAHVLHQLLWSLTRQTFKDFDVYLVDDSDQPLQWINQGPYPLISTELKRNGHELTIMQGPDINPATAYQLAFAKARGYELFLRCDDDSWLESDYLERLVSHFDNPNIAAVGGLFLLPGKDHETMRPDDERYKHAKIEHLSDGVNVQWYRHERKLIKAEHLTANIMFRRRPLEDINGFETVLYKCHRDETQCTYRLFVEGHDLIIDTRAVAWHLKAPSGGVRDGRSGNDFLEGARNFAQQRKSMKPGIFVELHHAVGDLIMATPIFRAIKEKRPNKELVVFHRDAPAILKGNPYVDHLLGERDIWRHQRTCRLYGSIYGWCSQAKWTGHLISAYFKRWELELPNELRPELHYDESLRNLELPDKFIVIAPFSKALDILYIGASNNKNWFDDRWNNLIGKIKYNYPDYKIYQIAGPDDDEPQLNVDKIERNLSWEMVYHLIDRASLLISVDTAAHHIARAFDTSSIVLWGRSEPYHFGYQSDKILNIQGKCPGNKPCVENNQWNIDIIACPLEERPCMNDITVDNVFEKTEVLLGKEARKTEERKKGLG